MTTVGKPRIDDRSEQPYLGIRTQVPMKGMFKVVDTLHKELSAWVKQRAVEPAGPPFLRYHVIDMDGEMDIEVGVPVRTALPGDERVSAGALPAGRYASLVYRGNGLAGNKALIEWARANGLTWDRWDDVKGDAFRARYETYLTDPKSEPRKTKWDIEVAIKLAEDPSTEMPSNRSMPESVVIPELAYRDVGEAVGWLCDVFGFEERLRIGNHRAQLTFNQGNVVVTQSSNHDPSSTEASSPRPGQRGERTHSIMVRVNDVDRHYERAAQRGARIVNPPADYPYGERQYTAEDPGGHVWTFSQTIADVDPATWGGSLPKQT